METKMRDMILREFTRRGWSIKRLADLTNTPYNGAYRFVKGKGSVMLTTAERFCAVLDLELKRKPKRAAKGAKS